MRMNVGAVTGALTDSLRMPELPVLDNPFKDGGPMGVDFVKDFSQTLSPPKFSMADWEIPGMGSSGAGGGIFGGAPAWQSLTPGAAQKTAQKTQKK